MTSFWSLIQDNSIVIPQIQRDYVQGRDTNQARKAREQLVDDIHVALTQDNHTLDLNYVYGQIDNDNQEFTPIDGQQRLSMLLALHIYIFAKEKKTDEFSCLKKFKYNTRETTRRFLKNLIDHIDNFFNEEYTTIKAFIEDAPWFSSEWKKDPSVNSFIQVLDDIHKRFQNDNDIFSKLTGENCPVTFSYLPIENTENMNDLYIKMNSRGKQLTEFECIKAELFKWIDIHQVHELNDFKKKMDNSWLDMIWNLLGEERAKDKYDETYKNFLVRIVKNRLRAENDKRSDVLSLFSGAEKEQVCEKIIKDIYFTFEICCELQQFSEQKELIINDETTEKNAKLFVLTSFAVNTNKDQWNKFDDWYRIMRNIIVNSDIDREEKLAKACQSIKNITTNNNTINAFSYFSKLTDDDIKEICGKQQGRGCFDYKQVEEERKKSLFIQKDQKWLDLFKDAENGYFNGQINFALNLSEIRIDKNEQTEEIEKFKATWERISRIFDVNKHNNNSRLAADVDEDLFRRALLTFGDYSFNANSSTKTFFFEGDKDQFSWRRMMKETASFNIFQKMFKELPAHDFNHFFEERIQQYNDEEKSFIFNLVKIGKIFSQMKQKRYYKNNNTIYLYKSQRCSADYYEAFSYFVFKRLCAERGENFAKYEPGKGDWENENNKETLRISKINGENFVIAYNAESSCFCNEDTSPYMNENGDNIKTIDEMVRYVDRKFPMN